MSIRQPAVVVGNPKLRSRTRAAASHVAYEITVIGAILRHSLDQTGAPA